MLFHSQGPDDEEATGRMVEAMLNYTGIINYLKTKIESLFPYGAGYSHPDSEMYDRTG